MIQLTALNEPANVTVNGQAATVRTLPGGSPYLFSKELALAAGTHQITVNAQDQANNTTLRRYNVTVGGTERTLTYDTNGNLTEEAVIGGSTRTYQWDSLNRLIAIQSDKVPVPGSWRTEFAYDGQSRRVGIVEQVREDSGWTTESSARYLWEGTEIIQKRDATGSTVTARYYDQGEIRVSGSTSVPSYFTRDHLGSVREVVNQSGVIAQSFDYTPWGERTSSTAGSLEWGFTGHHYHEKSGLCLAMFRAYDANLGRWLSEDPIGEAGGLNLYGYVGNEVLLYVDPKGDIPVVLAIIWLAGLAFAATAVAPEADAPDTCPVPVDPLDMIPPTPGEVAAAATGREELAYVSPKGLAKAAPQLGATAAQTARKILKDWDRLMQKMGKCLSPKRAKELKDLGDDIKSSDLPGSLQRDFPAAYRDVPLKDIPPR